MSRSFRRTCALLAPAAVLLSLCIPAAASAAPGDLPDLVQSRPGNVVVQDLRSVYVDAVKIVPVGHVQAR